MRTLVNLLFFFRERVCALLVFVFFFIFFFLSAFSIFFFVRAHARARVRVRRRARLRACVKIFVVIFFFYFFFLPVFFFRADFFGIVVGSFKAFKSKRRCMFVYLGISLYFMYMRRDLALEERGPEERCAVFVSCMFIACRQKAHA